MEPTFISFLLSLSIFSSIVIIVGIIITVRHSLNLNKESQDDNC